MALSNCPKLPSRVCWHEVCSLAPNLGKSERDKRYSTGLDWMGERLSQKCRAVLQEKTMNKVQFMGKEGPILSKVDWSLKAIHNGLVD